MIWELDRPFDDELLDSDTEDEVRVPTPDDTFFEHFTSFRPQYTGAFVDGVAEVQFRG